MKILIAGDIHIHIYSQLGTPEYWEQTYSNLARRFIDIAQEQGIKEIVLAGDIMHKATHPPRVAHMIKDFMTQLEEYFDKVYFILGQHDRDSKSHTASEKDTVLPVIGDKSEYMHGKVITIGGRSVGFCDWQVKSDFSFIQDKVDLLVGHLTLHPMFGQSYDSSKYDLCVAGDIHQVLEMDDGKTITTNIPVPRYIGDDQDGSIVVVDLEDMSYERVPTYKEGMLEYIRTYYDDKIPEAYKDMENLRIIERPKVINSASHVHKSIDIEEVINVLVKKHELEAQHADIATGVDHNSHTPADLSFIFHDIEIRNFRSIVKLDYTFDPGLALISGQNGAGKSSLMRAIKFVLEGDSKARNMIFEGHDSMDVKLRLTFSGREHIIHRGIKDDSGFLKYFIDGEEVTKDGMNATGKFIRENLTFLEFYSTLYREQKAPGFLSGYGYAARLELVSKLLGLSVIGDYERAANAVVSATSKSIKDLENEGESLRMLLESTENIDFSLLDRRDEIAKTIADGDIARAEIRRKIEIITTMQQNDEESAVLRNKIAGFVVDESHTLESYNAVLQQISEGEGMLAKAREDKESNVKANATLAQKISSQEYTITTAKTKLSNVVKDHCRKDTLTKELDEVEATHSRMPALEKEMADIETNCPTCGSDLDAAKIQAVRDSITKKMEEDKVHVQTVRDTIQLHLDNNDVIVEGKRAEAQDQLDAAEKVLADLVEEQSKMASIGNDQIDGISEVLDGMKKNRDAIKISMDNREQRTYYQGKLDALNVDVLPEHVALREKHTPLELYKESDAIDATMNQARHDQGKLGPLQDQLNSKIKYEERAQAIITEAQSLRELLVRQTDYVALFGKQGDVIKSVFTTVAESLSNDRVIVRTVKELASGEMRLDFDVDFKVGKLLLPYSELSGGQQTLVDIYFLTQIFNMSGNVGCLILDETLKELDVDALELAVQYITEAPINTTILSTHVVAFPYYDSRIIVELDDNESKYHIEGGA